MATTKLLSARTSTLPTWCLPESFPWALCPSLLPLSFPAPTTNPLAISHPPLAPDPPTASCHFIWVVPAPSPCPDCHERCSATCKPPIHSTPSPYTFLSHTFCCTQLPISDSHTHGMTRAASRKRSWAKPPLRDCGREAVPAECGTTWPLPPGLRVAP